MKQVEINYILAEHLLWLEYKDKIKQADFDKVKLQQANLKKANLREANLQLANLTDANLSGASLQGASLEKINLTEANLQLANLSGANLSQATLKGANLTDADLTDTNLSNANLRWANLQGADLTGADLSGVYVNYCEGDGKRIKSISNIKYPIAYTDTVLAIGCKQYHLQDWLDFDDVTKASFADDSLDYLNEWLPKLKALGVFNSVIR
jgi:uncharacterized protein YjbI with pentapeptide repeats